MRNAVDGPFGCGIGGISVILPAYNAEAFLGRTLATVVRQSVLPDEVVLVDDGSTDRTVDVAEQVARENPVLQVRIIRETHGGPGAARNAGIRAARGRWVAFLDADDLWEPDKIARCVAVIAANPSVNCICHNERMLFPDGVVGIIDTASRYDSNRPLPPQLFEQNLFSTSAVVCDREIIERAGGFDVSLSSSQDYEMWLRIAGQLRPLFVKEPLGAYVVRDGNISTSRFWWRLRNLLVVKHRHRGYVGAGRYCYSMIKVAMVHLLTPAVRYVRGLLRARRRTDRG